MLELVERRIAATCRESVVDLIEQFGRESNTFTIPGGQLTSETHTHPVVSIDVDDLNKVMGIRFPE